MNQGEKEFSLMILDTQKQVIERNYHEFASQIGNTNGTAEQFKDYMVNKIEVQKIKSCGL